MRKGQHLACCLVFPSPLHALSLLHKPERLLRPHRCLDPLSCSQHPGVRALIALSFSLDEDRSRAERFLLLKALHSYGLMSPPHALQFPPGSASVMSPRLLGCFLCILCFASEVLSSFKWIGLRVYKAKGNVKYSVFPFVFIILSLHMLTLFNHSINSFDSKEIK